MLPICRVASVGKLIHTTGVSAASTPPCLPPIQRAMANMASSTIATYSEYHSARSVAKSWLNSSSNRGSSRNGGGYR